MTTSTLILTDIAIPTNIEEIKKLFSEKIKINKKGCWLWAGYLERDGYAQLTLKTNDGWKSWRGHRLTYYLLHGFVPLLLDHIVCDTRNCINPIHVVPSTNTDNTRRGKRTKIDVALATMIRQEYGPPRGIVNKWNSRSPTYKELSLRYGVTQSVICEALKWVNKH